MPEPTPESTPEPSSVTAAGDLDRPTRLLADATRRLAAVSPSPAAEARILLAHVVGGPASRLLTLDRVESTDRDRFVELLEQRLTGRPVQHLTGVAWFRTVEVRVGPGVFVPRPETEVMTGWVLDRLGELIAAGTARPLVLEPCTGSGVISRAVAAECPAARIVACELDPAAHDYAVDNLAGTGAEVRLGDLATAFDDIADASVDVVVCNPPYIPLEAWESVTAQVRDHDPEAALFSGDDGLVAMRALAGLAGRVLRPGGVVAAEHAEVQAESAPRVFVDHGGFDRVRDHRDLAGRPRFVTGRARGRRPGAALAGLGG